WILHVTAAICLTMAAPFALVRSDQLVSVGRVVVWVGAGVITLLVATSYPVGWFALFYLWPLLGAAYVHTRGGFAGYVATVLAAYGAALAINGHHTGAAFPTLDYLMFVLATSTVMAAVRGLREGLDVLLDQLQVLSSTDALTGLANRRTFEQEFARCSEHATKTGDALTVLLFDLDHFKAINDLYGHPAGDEALRRFAGLLADAQRPGDTAARIGGEEFALIMRGADAAVASNFATDFGAVLRADGVTGEGRPPLTVSIGVAELTTQTASSSTLLIEADRALYEAKRTGRDRVVVARRSMAAGAD
ncbi:MAG: GGDEF domain-containing protein, partial [Patulibacter sp.]|nr:GGDEF domain-containing protein [Patulibacter sp.]